MAESFIALEFTMAAGAITIDDSSPSVVSTTPADMDIDVPVDTTIEIVFDREIPDNQLTTANLALLDPDGEAVPYSLNKVVETVTLTPDDDLENSTEYTLEISDEILSSQAINLKPAVTITFTTEA